MAKKKTPYSDEILEVFTDSASQKTATKIADDIKKIQGKFSARQDFKTTLLKRLKGTHMLDEATNCNYCSSIFRTIGVVFSCVFIFGVLYMIYDARQIQLQIYDNTKVSEQNIHDDIPEGVGHKEQNIIHDEFSDYQDSGEYTPLSREQLESLEDINVTQENEAVSEELSPQYSESVDFKIEKNSQTPKQEEAFSEPSQYMQNNDINIGDEDYENTYMKDAEIMGDSQDMYPSVRSMMLQAEDSESIYEMQVREFYRICEENEGEVLDDDYSCEFLSGEICTIDNITPESYEPCEYLYRNEKEE